MCIRDMRNYHGFQCICHDGKTFPNKFIYGLAEELKRTGQIKNFKDEFKIDGKFYDMCFNDENVLIEMDSGINHGNVIQKHKPNEFIPVKVFVNDMKKDEIAKSNNYKIIRIDCFKSEFDYIKNNIEESELSTLFDLSIIEWNNVLKLCTTNLIKEVCNYKKEHPDASVSEIVPLFNLSDVSIRKYLKMGNSLGWCIFDPEIERRNYLKRRKEYNAIPILVKSNEDSKYYKSMNELERNSEKDFGIKITRDKIVSNGIKKKGVVSIGNLKVYIAKGENIDGIQKTSSK